MMIAALFVVLGAAGGVQASGHSASTSCGLTYASGGASGLTSSASASVTVGGADSDGPNPSSASASASGLGVSEASAAGGTAASACAITGGGCSGNCTGAAGTAIAAITSDLRPLQIGCTSNDATTPVHYDGSVMRDPTGAFWFIGAREDLESGESAPFSKAFTENSLQLESGSTSDAAPALVFHTGLTATFAFDDRDGGESCKAHGDHAAA